MVAYNIRASNSVKIIYQRNMHFFTKILYFYEKVQKISKTAPFVGKGTPEPLIFLSISIPFHLGAPEVHFLAKSALFHNIQHISITYGANAKRANHFIFMKNTLRTSKKVFVLATRLQRARAGSSGSPKKWYFSGNWVILCSFHENALFYSESTFRVHVLRKHETPKEYQWSWSNLFTGNADFM